MRVAVAIKSMANISFAVERFPSTSETILVVGEIKSPFSKASRVAIQITVLLKDSHEDNLILRILCLGNNRIKIFIVNWILMGFLRHTASAHRESGYCWKWERFLSKCWISFQMVWRNSMKHSAAAKSFCAKLVKPIWPLTNYLQKFTNLFRSTLKIIFNKYDNFRRNRPTFHNFLNGHEKFKFLLNC